jgi:hypothetical protein
MTSTAFLCASLRLRHDPSGGAALRAGARDLEDDWACLQSLIAAERLAPLLHRTLGGLEIVPPDVAEVLRDGYRLTAVRNMLLLHALGACLRQLATAQVPVIVLKGAALAEVVYGNVSLRPMGDVDLLVHQRDLARTRHVLEGLGYVLGRAETHPGVLAEHENELVLCKPGPVPVFVDVHWSLFDSPYYQSRIAMDWFWQTAQPAQIAGVPALMLGPEAQIIHLCGHLSLHHGAAGLLWWHDIAEVLVFYRGRMNWTELLSRTRQYGLVLPVRAVLTRVSADWGAPIPAGVLHALRSHPPSRAEQRVFSRLSGAPRPAGQRFWSDLTSMPSWRQRLRFARTNLFPSAAYMQQRYRVPHPLLLPFYYPYRWLRGLRGGQ